jgi:twitching motility protein PilT
MVARIINSRIPDPSSLGLPPVLPELVKKKQGLLIVTGPTGSGKSTTLASLIEEINLSRSCHIVTIEDPVEYVYENKKSVIEQRELHADTLSFASALRGALREAPDVILVGEMRDVETMAAALTAAETGHLVLATLHTNSAPQTIERLVDSFPAAQQNQIRQQLAASLLAVVSQRLLPRRDRGGMVAAFEVMVGTAPVTALIRENKTHLLQSTLETGFKDGMQTMARALNDLYASGIISWEDTSLFDAGSKQVKDF